MLSAEEKAPYAAFELEMAAIKASESDKSGAKEKIAKIKVVLIKSK